MKPLNIVISGVGGQGTLLASRVLGSLALSAGCDIKVSEVHGMSQRGGSVTTYVRMGDGVRAALVEQNGADYVLAFEKLEALRALTYLKPGGLMVMNTQVILPMPVITGAAQYPGDVAEKIRQKGELVALDALALAAAAGNAKTVNTVLLGVLARRLDFARGAWDAALEANIPARFMQANLAAFEKGFSFDAAE